MTMKISYTSARTAESSQEANLCCRSTQFEKRPMHVSRTDRKYSFIVCSRCGTIAGLVDEAANSILEIIKAGIKRICDRIVG